MTLRNFLDATYALYVEELQRLGVNLIEALDRTASWRAHTVEEGVDPDEAAVVRQNEAEFKKFKELMAGT